jgi:hypothetical protein
MMSVFEIEALEKISQLLSCCFPYTIIRNILSQLLKYSRYYMMLDEQAARGARY